MNAIADTGFLVAFARAADTHHDWALSLARRIREPLLTCESVLSEAAFHLRSTAYVLALIDDGLVRLAFAADEHLPALARLARRYQDREPDFADLCLIRMSELFPKHKLITTDRADFTVYRRNGREVIPLICP